MNEHTAERERIAYINGCSSYPAIAELMDNERDTESIEQERDEQEERAVAAEEDLAKAWSGMDEVFRALALLLRDEENPLRLKRARERLAEELIDSASAKTSLEYLVKKIDEL